ncbi:MAG: LamG domain-containing protein [Bacteroidetes bacterium]|nr:LamG domain-containing protein [Bacteroidota bacterium]
MGIAAVPSGAICSGTSVTFTATPTNGGSLPTYQWKKNNVNVGSGGITYTDATLANNDAITCVMTSNASPCLTGSPATSNTLTITIFTLCNNIVAYWKFDESTGNAADAVGSNNGTPTDITYSTANGKIHNGAGFNGSSSKIVTSSNISISGNFSFACWVNVASYLNNYPLVMDLGTYGGGSGNSAFIIVGHIGVNRGVQFAYYQSGWYQATTNTQMSSGWHFIVGTVTVGGGGSAMVLYIDGNSAATGAAPSSVSINNTMSIGTDYTGVADKFYDGAIDEIGIWSRALTPAEVTSLYNNGTGLQYPF